MKLSPTIDIILSLATREMLRGGFSEIEPEHLLMGMLKFSEADLDSLEDQGMDSGFRGFLQAEQEDVERYLAHRRLDPGRLRRDLRRLNGRGQGVGSRSPRVHRSAQTKHLFSLAEGLAEQEHAGFLTTPLLLRTLIEHPTPLVQRALALHGGRKSTVRVATEKDLSRLLSTEGIEPRKISPLQAQAIERHLRHGRERLLLLVAEDDLAFQAVLQEMVRVRSGREDRATGRGPLVEVALAAETPEDEPLHRAQVQTSLAAGRAEGGKVIAFSGRIFSVSTAANVETLRQLAEVAQAEEEEIALLVLLPDSVYEALRRAHPSALSEGAVIHLLGDIEVLPPSRLAFDCMEGEAAIADSGARTDPPFFSMRAKALLEALLCADDGGDDPLDDWLSVLARAGISSGALAGFLGISLGALRKGLGHRPKRRTDPGERILTESERRFLGRALELARSQPDNREPGLVDVLHLAAALALTPRVCASLGLPRVERGQILESLQRRYVRELESSSIQDLTDSLKTLRQRLRERIFGQDQAIHAFVEALFNAEVVAAADHDRRRPKALLVFAGPPGVGKTFLAETGAKALGRPFKRFDMSAYSDHQSGASLIGFNPAYQNAQPGLLTGFVRKHPNAVLLFDEIEKAHLNVLQLFLQILDAGILEDKHSEEEVCFRNTLVIFTTNAGKSLYDRSDGGSTQVAFHRKTILGALGAEEDPRTGKPVFPAALCSRIATGHPILFNHLGVSELVRVAEGELRRQGLLLEEQYGKEVQIGDLVALCLVMREAGATDARTVSAQAGAFVKGELFRFSQLFLQGRLEEVLERNLGIRFELDPEEWSDGVIEDLRMADTKPRVLAVLSPELLAWWQGEIPEVDWLPVSDLADAENVVTNRRPEMAIIDLWLPRPNVAPEQGDNRTLMGFDFVPDAARDISYGRGFLDALSRRFPELPCLLLSRTRTHAGGPALVDDQLLLACMRTSGVRGLVETDFLDPKTKGSEQARDALAQALTGVARDLRLQAKARELAAERKALSFDTAPRVDEEGGMIRIRLRNLRIDRALAAEDVSEVLDQVDRPAIGFADVFGADAAKAELRFIVDWIGDPRRYRDLGLRPPRGILLYGPPGTGKTLLARALAGESKAGFITASASSFVTVWQGSGPENVRKLFARARRYAPAILFIDEIDAIGKKRVGGLGASAAAEQTLNALLTEMDGFHTPVERPVIVLAATNLVESLDEALRRRFDRDIEVDKPDRAARSGYLRQRLQGSRLRQVSDDLIQRLSGQSAGMTIADLERMVALAGRLAAQGGGIIDDLLAEEAFERLRMGERTQPPSSAELLRIARHEAGHCLVGWLAGIRPVQVTIMGRGRAGGFVEREAEEDRLLYTKPELEGLIRQCLGGRAAEIHYYGADQGLASGASGDLRLATTYARQMVCDYGMDQGVGPVVLESRQEGDGPLALELMRASAAIIGAQQERALVQIREHHEALDLLVEALMERNRLTRPELDRLWEGRLPSA